MRTPQPMVVPDYAGAVLSNVLPSIAARLTGVGEAALALPDAERYVVQLVDGLGHQLLADHAEHAPYLSGLLTGASRLTSGVPSTTATSLTCLGTGLAPGRHGVAGYTCRVPEIDDVMNTLTWDPRVDAYAFQPHATVFERLRREPDCAVHSVSPRQFEGTGLTMAALRGPRFVGVADESAEDFRIQAVVRAAKAGRRSLVYAYERELDHDGHGLGVASEQWLGQLIRIDRMCARLRAELPDEARLVITGDHGMLDVPGRNFVIVEDEPDLLAEVDSFAGEGRLRQFYTGNPAAVAQRWSDRMGDHAWVRTRDEAIEEGWFGPVEARVRDRFGDVLVAMRTDWAVMTRTNPRELNLIGMHGSLTPVEMYVPLLVD